MQDACTASSEDLSHLDQQGNSVTGYASKAKEKLDLCRGLQALKVNTLDTHGLSFVVADKRDVIHSSSSDLAMRMA